MAIHRHVVGGGPDVARWMQYDTLGRMVLNVEPNTSTDAQHAWRYAYDDAGDLVGTSDARGCGVNYTYDNGGRLLGEDYFPCQASHVPYSQPNWATGAGIEVRYRYDFPDGDLPSNDVCPINADLLVGRLVSVEDRAAKTVTGYDGRGRATCLARKVMNPAGTGYVDDWYAQRAAYDNADRTIAADTGAKSPELMGSDGQSQLTTSFTLRGTVADVGGSYGTLASQVIHDADGLPQSITYGDLAATQTAYSYDDRLRLKNVITYRGPPSQWSDPAAYAPAPTYKTNPNTTFQLVLQNYDYTYDAVDNPIEIRNWRIASEWPAGSKPVSRKIDYDDLYRVKKVDYTYEAGDDAWTSPFDAENQAATNGTALDSKLAKPSPHVSFDKRVLSQSFAYDAIGNSTQTDDDAHGFYDRSLGTITNGTSGGGKPYQLTSATNESTGSARRGHLTAAYDAAGNLTSMAVQRNGTCLPTGAQCSQRYAYEWDEAGRLSRARRWDLASAGAASDAVPAGTAAADLSYAYDSGDQRVRKTATDASGNQVHTLYPLGSLEVRRAAFDGTKYERSYATEVPYLLAHGVRLGRVAYEASDVPQYATTELPAGRLHVFLELADHLGSTSIVIDKATSELVEAGTYQAYGAAESDYRPERWKSFREDHRFTGKEEDVEVGLQYFGFRYYAPQLGRWVSADPLAVHSPGAADLNVYAYVTGLVLKATDPVGLNKYCPSGHHNNGDKDFQRPSEYIPWIGMLANAQWNFDVGVVKGFDFVLTGITGGFGASQYDENGTRYQPGYEAWKKSWEPWFAAPSSPREAQVMGFHEWRQNVGMFASPIGEYPAVGLAAESKSTVVAEPIMVGGATGRSSVATGEGSAIGGGGAAGPRHVEGVGAKPGLDAPFGADSPENWAKAHADAQRDIARDPDIGGGEGTIYRVPGSGTPSGRPYVGSADDLGKRTATARDGRDRQRAEVIGSYPIGDTNARKPAEQTAIDDNGGVTNLDNKRNEIKK